MEEYSASVSWLTYSLITVSSSPSVTIWKPAKVYPPATLSRVLSVETWLLYVRIPKPFCDPKSMAVPMFVSEYLSYTSLKFVSSS